MNVIRFLLLLMCATNAFASELTDAKTMAMASEGAPSNVTSNATIMKFVDGDFKIIREGVNNFTCMVISDPQGRYEPSCFNEEAMRSVFPTYRVQMELLYAGKSHEFTNKEIQKQFEQKNLPTAEIGAMVYMMSPNNMSFNRATKELAPTPIHHMYYYPKLQDETFSLSGQDVFVWQGYPHLTALIVVVK